MIFQGSCLYVLYIKLLCLERKGSTSLYLKNWQMDLTNGKDFNMPENKAIMETLGQLVLLGLLQWVWQDCKALASPLPESFLSIVYAAGELYEWVSSRQKASWLTACFKGGRPLCSVFLSCSTNLLHAEHPSGLPWVPPWDFRQGSDQRMLVFTIFAVPHDSWGPCLWPRSLMTSAIIHETVRG